MKSVIKTKINKVHLPFNQQIRELKGTGDMSFLKELVEASHKKAETMQIDDNTLEVCTKRNYYRYSCFPNYIRQINTTTDTRSYFKIS